MEGVIGRLRLVLTVKEQSIALGPMGEPAKPGVFIREAPSLNGGAAGMLQANSCDLAIDLGLPFKILRMKWFAIAADRQCDIHFGDVDLHA